MEYKHFMDWYRDNGQKEIARHWEGVEARDIKWQLQNAHRKGGMPAALKELDRLIAEKIRAEARACLQGLYRKRA